MSTFFKYTFLIFGILSIVAACVLTGYNVYIQDAAGKKAADVMEMLFSEIPSSGTSDGGGDKGGADGINEEDNYVPDYVIDPTVDMPEMKIDDVPYIGYIEIPLFGIKLPVIAETTGEYLNIAPCRLDGSAYLDNFVIGGHNFTTHFGPIGNLSYRDKVKFVDTDGNVFTYEVISIEVLDGNQKADLCSGEWPLTLYTCTLSGFTRVTVRCERVD